MSVGTKIDLWDRIDSSDKSYWQKFRERKRAHVETKGTSDDDSTRPTEEPHAQASDSATPAAVQDYQIGQSDSFGPLKRYIEHRVSSAPSAVPRDGGRKWTTFRDSGIEDDPLGTCQVHVERRKLLGLPDALEADYWKKSTPMQDFRATDRDSRRALQIRTRRRELLASPVTHVRQNSRARRQAKAKQNKRGTEGGAR